MINEENHLDVFIVVILTICLGLTLFEMFYA